MKKTEKPLTVAQFKRMLRDRSDELVAIVAEHLKLERVPQALARDVQTFVRENYCADKGVDAPC